MLRKLSLLFTPGLIVMLVISAAATEREKVVTDPSKAGPDFAVQGEYEGQTPRDGKPTKHGAQVIALGSGKFRCVRYEGGLPGAGWDGSKKEQIEGQTGDGVPTFSIEEEHVVLTIQDGVLSVTKTDGTKLGALKKVARQSPTLGAKPPAGAIVLFDGTTPDHFRDGRMTKDGLLMEGATSQQDFQSFTLHLEFRTPFKPHARGQERGNSGFYAQGRYEVQILDSFGLEGRDNECGGIYSIGPPKVNMCLPPLSWQTYDVDFTAAEYQGDKKVKHAMMTVRHNGVLIHENQELDHRTTAAPLAEGPDPGPVFLQDHGNPVRFRNVWIVPE